MLHVETELVCITKEGIVTQPKEKKLMVRVRERIRTKGYAKRTEKTYVHWILKFINFHGVQHPMFRGVSEIEAFLTHIYTEARSVLFPKRFVEQCKIVR